METLLEKKSQFSITPIQFDLGAESTIQQDSLLASKLDLNSSTEVDLQGQKGPQFDLGAGSTIQQDSLTVLDTDLNGEPGPLFNVSQFVDPVIQQYELGSIPDSLVDSDLDLNGEKGPQFDLGMFSSTLHEDSITNIPFSYKGNFFPLSYDLNGEEGPQFDLGTNSNIHTFENNSPSGPSIPSENSLLDLSENGFEMNYSFFDKGKNSTLHDPDSLLEKYTYQYGEPPWLSTAEVGPSTLDLNGSPSLNYNVKSNSNSPFISRGASTGDHLKDLLTQAIASNNSKVGYQPSSLDLDGTEGGQGYFHGIASPGHLQGKQIAGEDLHIHLLDKGYTYTHGDETGFVGITHGTKGSKIVGGRLDLDLTTSTPKKYEDTMKGDISQYTS